MKKRALLLGLLLFAADASASTSSPGFVIVQRSGRTAAVTSTDGWDLYVLYSHQYLDVRPLARGIDIATRGEPGALVRFASRTPGELHCGDVIAIAVEGVWLRWDATQKPLELTAEVEKEPLAPELYQWRLAGCRSGETITTGRPIAIANTIGKDALVGCRRVYGPPFCWDEKQLMGLEKKEMEQ